MSASDVHGATQRHEQEVREGRHRRLPVLWYALIGVPLIYLLSFLTVYNLVPARCQGHSGTMLIAHLVHLVTLILVVLAGVLAWHEWRRLGAERAREEGGALGTDRFMAELGILTSAMFTIVVIAQWFPTFVLNPCQ